MAKDARELPPPAGDEGAAAERSLAKSTGQRTCSVCGVTLSQYNPGPHCWQHTVGWPWRGPSAKPHY
jgi:hypothetical protein